MRHCHFCEQEEPEYTFSSDIALCEDCVSKFRTLVEQTNPDIADDVIGFEPVSYEYSPSDGEIMYLQPDNQLYRIELRTEGLDQEVMIYLHPIPKNRSPKPITDLRTDIGEAIEQETFYRVTIEADDFRNSELWWVTAIALAPDPETDETDHDESSPGEDSELILDESDFPDPGTE